MLETLIQRKIKKWLRAHGWLVIKLRATDPPSFPDLMAMREGKTVWFIEVKRPGEHPTELQDRNISILRAMGFRVDVWTDVPKKDNKGRLIIPSSGNKIKKTKKSSPSSRSL
jgi:Holliday junction resolvase